jgi:type VI secretion system secreted protein VgrG
MPPKQNRTLHVRCDALPTLLNRPALTAVRLTGEEGVNSLFRYELVMATAEAMDRHLRSLANDHRDVFLDPDKLIGQALTIDIELAPAPDWRPDADRRRDPDPATRQISGVITEACFLRREGRRSLYRFTLQPWLHAATLNQNCRIFQDLTAREILQQLLNAYTGSVRFQLFDSLPKRDFQVQYQESDFTFFSRLCEEWGLSYHFLHADDQHTLVLRDRWLSNPPNPGHAWRDLEFHAPGHRFDSEYLHTLVTTSRMSSGDYVGSDYDYQTSHFGATIAWCGDRKILPNAGPEIFDFQGQAHYAQAGTDVSAHSVQWADEGRQLAYLRMDALRCERLRAHGAGHLRGMVPGHSFSLTKHPDRACNRDYLILHTRLDMQETLQESHPTPLGGRETFADETRPGQHHSIEVEMVLHPLGDNTTSYRPPACTPRPLIHGVQMARVVGPAGQEVHTDASGRIKVHFLWDRTGRENESSSCWIRVMSFSAGRQMGAIHLPRIGDEIAVTFIGGDPDLPMAIGSLRNTEAGPSYRLPLNLALSGYRSHELGGDGGRRSTRHNLQVFDDTPDGIQVQLGSDHGASLLSLGHITRITKHLGRQDHRGQGFELRTDAAGSVRAGAGLVVTTEKRDGAAGIVLALAEPVQRLAVACEQHEMLAGLARAAGAQDTGTDQQAVAAAIARQAEEIGKLEALAPLATPAATPNLLLASAAGLAATSAGATHLASGRDTAITSGGHSSISAGGNLLASAMGAIRLMAQKAGLRLVAATADIDIEALQGKLRLLALVDISLVAGRITVTARQEVVINGGGSTTRWSASGIESATSGRYRVRSAGLDLSGPSNQPVQFATPSTPAVVRNAPLMVSLQSYARQGKPVGNQPYEVSKAGAVVAQGVTDALGRMRIEDHQAGASEYLIHTVDGTYRLLVEAELKDATEQRLGNAGFRNPTAAATKAAARRANAPGGTARGDNYPDAT